MAGTCPPTLIDDREDLAVVQRAEGGPDEHDAEAEAEVPHPVDDERLLARDDGGLLLVPEADEQIGAEPDRLPEDVEEEEVVGEDQHDHREDEQVQIREEAGVPVVAVHVPDRVHVNQEADAGDDEQHDRGELIDLGAHRHVERARLDPGEQLSAPRLAVPDAREHGAGGNERRGQRGVGDPVRPVAGDPAAQCVDHGTEQRKQRNQPDEM